MRMINQLEVSITKHCSVCQSFELVLPVVGTLCIYNEGSGSEAIRQQCGTYQQYNNSLVRSCQQNPPRPAEVVFRPDDTTPDVVYYQVSGINDQTLLVSKSPGLLSSLQHLPSTLIINQHTTRMMHMNITTCAVYHLSDSTFQTQPTVGFFLVCCLTAQHCNCVAVLWVGKFPLAPKIFNNRSISSVLIHTITTNTGSFFYSLHPSIPH